MSADLLVVIPEGQSIVEVFQDGGCDPLIDKLEAELKSYAIDVTTEAGRKQIASIARKIASTKVALDDAGKALIADKQAQVALVNKERARIKDRMQKMQDDFRRPLTEFEAEAKRQLEALEQKKREEAAAREQQLREEAAKQAAEEKIHQQPKEPLLSDQLWKQPDVKPPTIGTIVETKELPNGSIEIAIQPHSAEQKAVEQAEYRVRALEQIGNYIERMKTEDIVYLIGKIKARWFITG